LLAFPGSAAVLERELHTLDSGALQALALLLDDGLRDSLASAFRHIAMGDDAERAVIAVQVLTVKPLAEDEALLRGLMASDHEPLAAAAISGFAVLRGQAAVDDLAPFLDDRSGRKAAAAMAGLMKYGGAQGAVLADVRLDTLLHDDDPWKRLFCVQGSGGHLGLWFC
jgi:hypothetical protein